MEYFSGINSNFEIKIIELIIFKVIFLFSLIVFPYKNKKFSDLFDKNYTNFVKPNIFFLSNYFQNINNIIFNLSYINYSIESNKNILKVEYLIDFYNYNKSIIPSDLTLINKFHILCISKEIKSHNYIIYLANIIKNKHYKCIEFFNRDEEIIFGIKIYKIENNFEYKNIDLFSYKKHLNYNFISDINYTFDCFQINENFKELINSTRKKNKYKLLESYIQKPLCIPKNKFSIKRKKWIFTNIYNFYFCFCKGPPCYYQNIPQKCKYYFYLNIIDNNKDVYKKTDYLFGDFIFYQYSSDDTYPIFEEMMKQNLPAHYLTQNMNIYLKYCNLNKKCLKIIRFSKNEEFINGDFLEKYLDIILKLKVVATGAEFSSFENIFYNIDYISYISIGHGVSFLKHFLYESNSYYGNKKYNKILIPPSKKLISITKYYGWNEKDIIKINLPRWDKYNNYNNTKNRSIFIMFTWRELAENKKLNNDYVNGILDLINNKKLAF